MGKKKTHTRAASREPEREARRAEVRYESLIRTCSCPAWEDHNPDTCITLLEVSRHKARLKR
eukprot:8786558-Karenia_brevis.AAC.1